MSKLLPPARYNEDGRLMSTRDEVSARVDHIVDLMVRGEFKRGETYKDLAKEWGIEPATVRGYASMASRIAWDDSDESRDELKAQSITKLLAIADEAHAGGKLKDATGAIKVANEVAGVLRPGPAVAIQNNQINNAARSLPPHIRERIASLSDIHGNAYEWVFRSGGEHDDMGENEERVREMLATFEEIG